MRTVPDPRCRRKKKHDLAEVLTYIVIGFLVGRTTLRRSLAWCGRHLKWLGRYMKLENGIASAATVSRMLCRIDEYLFAMAFMEWIGEILEIRGIHLIIDGKALRAATERVKNSRTPMVMNALDAATGLVLAQLPVEDKGCELNALPELLKLLNLKENIVTIDAIGTQTNIMGQIIGEEGHFVLTVKKNQPTAYDEIMGLFEEILKDLQRMGEGYPPCHPGLLEKYGESETHEKNRDRHEHRYYKVCHEPSCLPKIEEEWPFIKTVGHVRQIRIPIERDAEGNDITPDEKMFLAGGSRRNKKKPVPGDGISDDIQDVGMVSDMALIAARMGEIKRAHWKIENRLHHVLDETFREDRSPAKKSKNTLAIIRKFAYNILRLAMIRQQKEMPMTEMMDSFADDHSLIEEYVFAGIESFY